MAEKLPAFKSGDVDHIDVDNIRADMLAAYVKYGDKVAERVSALMVARIHDSYYHRVFSIVKGMLSSGFKLDVNIVAGRIVTDHIIQNPDTTPDRIIHLLKEKRVYQGRGPKGAVYNIHRVIHWILSARDEDMTYQNLIRIKGIGPKIASWIMSLYFGVCDHFTLDVHMYRGLFGTTEATTDAIHRRVEKLLVELVHDVVPGVAPLVVQWSMWCMYRGDQWDHHTGIVRSDLK